MQVKLLFHVLSLFSHVFSLLHSNNTYSRLLYNFLHKETFEHRMVFLVFSQLSIAKCDLTGLLLFVTVVSVSLPFPHSAARRRAEGPGYCLIIVSHSTTFSGRRSVWCYSNSAVMNGRVALSVAFLLVVLTAPRQTHGKRGPPGGGPPGLAGGGPPGHAGGGPPGHAGGGPPGLNKPGKGKPHVDYEDNDNFYWFDRDDDRRKPPITERIDVNIDTGEKGQQKNCRKNEFRCGSGECVPETERCDNKFDCRDSSDENGCAPKPEVKPGCVLPEQPVGGSYTLGGCSNPCSKRPGDKVPNNSILTFTCRDNYILSGGVISVCVNETWHNPPSCLRTCTALSSSSVNIVCTYQGNNVSCTERIRPGTVGTLSCKPSYKLPVTNDPAYRTVTCLDDGIWDRRIFRCLPECGIPISKGNTLVVNGFETKLGVFPWHVGIYQIDSGNKYTQICGGSLISNNLVVTAAHCFYDEVYGKVYDKSLFAVGAGKHYRDWNANENYAQKSLLAEILIPERYIGARANFAQDIALLKLASPLELTALVQPICIDWDNVYERKQLQVGQRGKSAGWGRTITGEASETLQEVSMPFVPYGQCLSAVPNDFRGYITSDKFCAGRLNGSSLCEGDSGGGLCFEMDGTWYLRGIVSVSPVKDSSCDYNQYTVFTSTGYFRDWIRATYVSA